MLFTLNPELETYAPDGWLGTPLDSNGKFVNLNYPFKPEFSKLIQWQTQKNPQKAQKKSEKWFPEVFTDNSFLFSKDDCFVWLGHSSFFIRMDGIGLLIDPVFGNASIVPRKTVFPYADEIGKYAQFLLISHDHRDHCDLPSLKKIAIQNPNIQVVTGLNMKSVLTSVFAKDKIQEAGWYQKYKLPFGLEIWFLPSRHWSRRSLSDTNKRLWGGFHISSISGHSYFFMGDSGYDTHFSSISHLFKRPSFAFMGIGAYSPEWFMHSSHMTPESSWKAFNDLGGEIFIPMHYGTFDLADEPMSEPIERLKAVAQTPNLLIPTIGKPIWI
jgi:L-ascorbate metabolism protein UlaG (beta-lactamase superfamily)